MRILITGSLVFLLWACFASWFYVCKIKPNCVKPAEKAIAASPALTEPSPAVVTETEKPQTLVLYFAFNSSEVNPNDESGKQAIIFNEWLGKHPESMLHITGHTDSKGSDTFNKSLGMKRAENTMKYLTGKGISMEKMTGTSMGEAAPDSDNNSEEGRSKNRRTEITLK